MIQNFLLSHPILPHTPGFLFLSFSYTLLFFCLFYFWLHWVFPVVHSLSLVAMLELLVEVAPLVVKHRLQARGSITACGLQAQLLHGLRNLPGPGIKLVSPALAGGFLSTAPPRKSLPFLSFGPSGVSKCWPRRWRKGYCLRELHSLHSKHEVPPGTPADHQRRSFMTLYSWALMDCV